MRYLLLLGLSVVLALSGCAPVTPVMRDENATRGAIYGDSYTLGTGTTDPSQRWSTIICAERGWHEFNSSVNGLGFVNNRATDGERDLPALVIADDPDIVFITMGLNKNFSYDRAADQIRLRITEDFTYLQAELPDARFVVVELFWYTDYRPESVALIIGWVRDAAAEIGADYISGASHWIGGHPGWMASDGLHPDDEGYTTMEGRMDTALVELGL